MANTFLPDLEWQKVGRVAVGAQAERDGPRHVQKGLSEEGLPAVVVTADVLGPREPLAPMGSQTRQALGWLRTGTVRLFSWSIADDHHRGRVRLRLFAEHVHCSMNRMRIERVYLVCFKFVDPAGMPVDLADKWR